VIAVQQADGKVFVSWRLFATDSANTPFNLYRTTAAAQRTDGRRFGLGSNGQPRPNGAADLHDYKIDGKLLWTINLVKNIREGAHYTQFMVYDLECSLAKHRLQPSSTYQLLS
jgi:hypothetical protein